MGDSLSWAAEQEEMAEWRKLEELKKKNAVAGDKRPILSKYNEQEKELHEKMSKYPKLNGLLCDKCNAELYDTNGVIIRTRVVKGNWDNWSIVGMSPGMIDVHCKCCKFEGRRIA